MRGAAARQGVAVTHWQAQASCSGGDNTAAAAAAIAGAHGQRCIATADGWPCAAEALDDGVDDVDVAVDRPKAAISGLSEPPLLPTGAPATQR